jgi:hypothetical protein
VTGREGQLEGLPSCANIQPFSHKEKNASFQKILK